MLGYIFQLGNVSSGCKEDKGYLRLSEHKTKKLKRLHPRAARVGNPPSQNSDRVFSAWLCPFPPSPENTQKLSLETHRGFWRRQTSVAVGITTLRKPQKTKNKEDFSQSSCVPWLRLKFFCCLPTAACRQAVGPDRSVDCGRRVQLSGVLDERRRQEECLRTRAPSVRVMELLWNLRLPLFTKRKRGKEKKLREILQKDQASNFY